jgi:hypothetical protein
VLMKSNCKWSDGSARALCRSILNISVNEE